MSTKRNVIDILVVLASFTLGDLTAEAVAWIIGRHYEVLVFIVGLVTWGAYYFFLRDAVDGSSRD